MSRLQSTAQGYVGYRGREGQWSFLLHRLTGLGTLLFLIIHIVDTSTVYFAPQLYEEVLALYQSTVFGLGEIALVFAVFYHGVNGLRLAVLDLFAPRAWLVPIERNSARITFGVTMLMWLPSALWMLRNLLYHNYGLFGG